MRTQELKLQYNRPVRIAGTTTIECVAGRVWLTRTGGAGDLFLRPGERLTLEWPDMVLAEALGAASGGARLVLHRPVSLWRRALERARLVLSSMNERMRALRRVGRRGPLAG